MACSCQPAEATAKPDEEIGMFDELNPLLEGDVAGEVFRIVRNVVPNKAQAVSGMHADAENSVACFLEVFDDGFPSVAIVPIFALGRCLSSDANVRFLNLAFGTKLEFRDDFFWVDTKDVACSPMQANLTEINRLPVDIPFEEKANSVGSVRFSILDRFRRAEGDVFVLVLEELNDKRPHTDFDLTVMLLSESFRIREPANKVTEGTDWVAD